MSTFLVCAAMLFAGDANLSFGPTSLSDKRVEKAARDFRIRVYHLFRRNRPQYDAHRAAGDEMLKRWREAKQPVDYRDEIVRWFAEAELAGQDATRTLPDYPALPDPPAVQEVASGDPSVAPHLPALDRPEIDTGNPFADITGEGGNLEFLQDAKPIEAANDAAPRWTPPSQILKSVRRALLISAGSPDQPDTSAQPDPESNPFDSPALNEVESVFDQTKDED